MSWSAMFMYKDNENSSSAVENLDISKGNSILNIPSFVVIVEYYSPH